MKRSRLPLHAIRTFEAAAEKRSFTLAAEELSVTHAAVSHQIRHLENHFGTPLFDRSKRPLKLTDAGERLLDAVRAGFDRIAEGITELEDREFEGSLIVLSVPGLGVSWLTEVLGEFVALFPKVRVRMITNFWHMPAPVEDADLCIAFGSAEQTGRRVTLLGHSEVFPVCSPRLAIAQQSNVGPHDILNHTIIYEHSTETWRRWFLSCGLPELGTTRSIYFDGAHLTLQAARVGAGIAMGDMPTVGTDLREGRLVRLSDHAVPMTHPYYLTTLPDERLKPAAKALEMFILERFQKLELR